MERYGDLVPVRWYEFQALAKDLVHDGERRITFTQACEMAGKCEVSGEECCRMLQEFHDLGFIIWVDTPATRQLVVLDVQWMMDQMTALLCHRSIKEKQRRSRSQRRLWGDLAKGRLSPRLLPEVWPELTDDERQQSEGQTSNT